VGWLVELEDRERSEQGQPLRSDDDRRKHQSVVIEMFDEVGRLLRGALLQPYAGDPAQVAALAGFTSFFLERFLKPNVLVVSPDPPFLRRDDRLDAEMNALKHLMRRFVYESPGLVAQQRGQKRVIKTLFEVFGEAATEADQCALLPAHLHERAKKNGKDKAGGQRIAMDAITCLTEEQALRLYRRVTGLETGSLLDGSSPSCCVNA
jgi:dGTPase